MTGQVLVAVALGAVAIILLAGLYTMFVGGATSLNWSNRLMRLRVLVQFIAVLLILAVMYFAGR